MNFVDLTILIIVKISDDEWDEVLREMVDVYSDKDSGKQADKLAQRIKCNVAKINAYIACNKLKAAYVIYVVQFLSTCAICCIVIF